jgi:hypothetical protein
VGELVNEIMGRIVALNGAASGPILGQQRTDNEAGTANANGGEYDERGDHLAGLASTEHRSAARPIGLAGDHIECAEVVFEDSGRRMSWRLFDAPLACRGDQTSVIHAAAFDLSGKSAVESAIPCVAASSRIFGWRQAGM